MDVDEDEKQSQEGPEENDKSFEETSTGIPRREAVGRDIDRPKPTMGG